MATQVFPASDCVIFRKTRDEYGDLSNMAAGFPLTINGINVRTPEALYQACKFPNHPKVQKEIIDQYSPIAAKMVSRSYGHLCREDWLKIRVDVMRWVLQLKISIHYEKFSQLLLSTGDKPIVEYSRHDDFWGAIQEQGTLTGENMLGQLLMELREQVKNNKTVKLSKIENLILFEQEISQ